MFQDEYGLLSRKKNSAIHRGWIALFVKPEPTGIGLALTCVYPLHFSRELPLAKASAGLGSTEYQWKSFTSPYGRPTTWSIKTKTWYSFCGVAYRATSCSGESGTSAKGCRRLWSLLRNGQANSDCFSQERHQMSFSL
jgi:hypothetical protein